MRPADPTRKRVTKRQPPPLDLILRFYDVHLREHKRQRICIALKIADDTYQGWLDKWPQFALAKKMAEESRGKMESLSSYLFGHLSEESQVIWRKLQFWDGNEDQATKVHKLLKPMPKAMRQELYLHALFKTNFDPSSALRMTGVTRVQLEEWKTDPEFRSLIEEVQWHKKNFFEKALLDLVEQKYPAAVIHVNKTINADRGYNDKLEVHHSGAIDTGGVDIEELDLPIEVRRVVLDAVRRSKAAKAITNAHNQAVLEVPTVKQLSAPEEDEEAA